MQSELFQSQSQFAFEFRKNLCFLFSFHRSRRSTKFTKNTIGTCQESTFSFSPEKSNFMAIESTNCKSVLQSLSIIVQAKAIFDLEIWKMKRNKLNSSFLYCLMWFLLILGFWSFWL